MIGNIGPLEIGIVILVILLLFGAKRLPEVGSSLGRGMREFKDGITGENRRRHDQEALGDGTPSDDEDRSSERLTSEVTRHDSSQ